MGWKFEDHPVGLWLVKIFLQLSEILCFDCLILSAGQLLPVGMSPVCRNDLQTQKLLADCYIGAVSISCFPKTQNIWVLIYAKAKAGEKDLKFLKLFARSRMVSSSVCCILINSRSITNRFRWYAHFGYGVGHVMGYCTRKISFYSLKCFDAKFQHQLIKAPCKRNT